MRIASRLLWTLLFVLATYSWMVLFEHGISVNRFKEGFKSEWRNVGALLMGKPPGPIRAEFAPEKAPKS